MDSSAGCKVHSEIQSLSLLRLVSHAYGKLHAFSEIKSGAF